MTQYDDDYDIDYTGAPSSSGGGKQSSSQSDMSLDPYDDLLDVDALDDASWDEPIPQAQPRKAMKSGKAVKGGKKSLFAPLLIGGAVLAGLGILYVQFSGPSAPTTPSAMPSPMPTAEMPMAPNAMPPAGNVNPAIDPTTGQPIAPAPAGADLLALQQAQSDPNAVPTPMPQDNAVPAPQTGGLLNDPNLLPPAQAPTTPDAAATPNMPSANDVQKANVAANTETVVETPPAPAPAIVPEPQPTPVAPTTPAPVAETQTANTPTPTASAQPQPAPNASPEAGTTTISTKELDELRATIARLESKVKELESKPIQVAETTSPLPSSSSSLADEVAPVPKKKTSSTKKKSSSDSNTKSSTSKTKKSSDKKTASLASTWELRGIAGGEAIVAKRGSEDFQSVGVGDNLSGVGTIKSITNQNGSWVIEGTNGKIRQ